MINISKNSNTSLDEFEINFWNSEEIQLVPGFTNLLNRVFYSPQKRDSEHFLWKHKQNPFGPSIVVYASNRNTGSIVAFRAFMRWQLIWQSKIINSFQPCDSATAEECRRIGLFSKLTNAALKFAKDNNGKILFNFPNKFSRGAYLKMGWIPIGKLVTLVKPSIKNGFKNLLSRTVNVSDNLTIFKKNTFKIEDNIFNLMKCTKGIQNQIFTGTIQGNRTAEIYEWRMKRPGKTYRLISTEKAAAFVLVKTRRGFLEACIIDLVFDCYPKQKYFNEVIDMILKLIKPDFISTFVTEKHPYIFLYNNAHFIRIPNESNFVAYPLVLNEIEEKRVRWALGGFDIDTF
jgi:hypothetical protein